MPGSASDTEQWGQSTLLLGQWVEDTLPSLMGSWLENAALSSSHFPTVDIPRARHQGALCTLSELAGPEPNRWSPDPGLSLGSVD